VTRRPSLVDGRGRIVALTSAGVRLVDDLLPSHLANEAALLTGLSPEQRDQLAQLLGELIRSLEGSIRSGAAAPPPPAGG